MMIAEELFKYPRTHHIEGSRLQPGDEDLESVSFSQIAGRHLVVEEKVDGANSAISFSDQGDLLVQSRGHYLTGGPREKHFQLLKTWSNCYVNELYELLGTRYVMYGEWLYAKHTIFYDQLPHYFMEFDIFDKQKRLFLSTRRRQQMLQAYPCITSVKVLSEGPLKTLDSLRSLLVKSHFIGEERMETFRELCDRQRYNLDRALLETDPSQMMEGLYIKVENDDEVEERYKFVRHDFLTTVLNSQSHWLSRPIIPNQLRPGTNLFAQHGSSEK